VQFWTKQSAAIVLSLMLCQARAWSAQPAPPAAAQAEQDAKAAMDSHQFDKAEQLYGQAADMLRASGTVTPRLVNDLLSQAHAYLQSGNDKAAQAACQQALSLIGQLPSAPPDLVARAYSTLAHACLAVGDLQGTINNNNQALSVLKQQYGPNSARLVDPMIMIGTSLAAQDKLPQAEQTIKDVMNILGNGNGHEMARCLMTLGEIYNAEGKFDEAEPALKRALGLYQTDSKPDYAGEAATMSRLARTYVETGRVDDAEGLLNKAIITQKKTSDASVNQNRQVVWFMIALGDIYNRQGKHEQAETQFDLAQDVSKAAYIADHYINAIILNRLASTYIQEGKYAEAEKIYRQILSFTQTSALSKKPTSGPFQLGLTASAKAEDTTPENQDGSVLNEALERSKKSLGQAHPEVANAFSNLGWVCLIEGKYDEAQTDFQQAFDIRKAAFGLNHQMTAASLQSLAALNVKEKKFDQAESYYQQALNINKKLEGDHNLQIIQTLISLANVHSQQGNLNKAEQDLKDALAKCNTLSGPKKKIDPNAVLDDAASQISAQAAMSGDSEEVTPLVATALSINPDQLTGPQTPIAATVLINLTRVLTKESKLNEAESVARQALQIRQHCYGPDRPLTAQAMAELSAVLQAENQLPEADSLLQQAVAISKTSFGDHSKQYAAAISRLAKVEDLEGKTSEAKALEAQASSINDSDTNASNTAQ